MPAIALSVLVLLISRMIGLSSFNLLLAKLNDVAYIALATCTCVCAGHPLFVSIPTI